MTTCGFATWEGGLRGGRRARGMIFPDLGTFSAGFSNGWKFSRRFFQTLENVSRDLSLCACGALLPPTWIILLEVGSSYTS